MIMNARIIENVFELANNSVNIIRDIIQNKREKEQGRH